MADKSDTGRRNLWQAIVERKPVIEGFSSAEIMTDPLSRRGLQDYVFQAGQPPEVREAFLAAMGFSEAELQPDQQPFDPLAPAPPPPPPSPPPHAGEGRVGAAR